MLQRKKVGYGDADFVVLKGASFKPMMDDENQNSEYHFQIECTLGQLTSITQQRMLMICVAFVWNHAPFSWGDQLTSITQHENVHDLHCICVESHTPFS